MVLVKVPVSETLSDIDSLCRVYNGTIINVSKNSIVVMVADEPRRVKFFIEAIQKHHPIEIVRGGVVALER